MSARGGVVAAEWDYTSQAPYYHLRPNYAASAIEELCARVNPTGRGEFLALDVGAGTGNLSLLLVARGVRCLALEPNTAMRTIGARRTEGLPVAWIAGAAEETPLAPGSVDLFVLGSSFNCTDRLRTLRQAHGVLRAGGHFACLWNHRDLQEDPVQRRVEEVLRSEIPDYGHGERRQDQSEVILSSGCFEGVDYFERDQVVTRTPEEYLGAWRSVRNGFWDQESAEGRQRFGRILERMRRELAGISALEIRYTTRVWLARRAHHARSGLPPRAAGFGGR